jgi:glycosyltransferase involved in cell wall biosynthesis
MKTPTQNQPRVTIGIPTYNGGPYLRDCLNDILAQTYQDYAVIISDNASTDETADIARDFAAKDPRFRYLRQNKKCGVLLNFHAVARTAETPFFIWHADDDAWAPNYLEELVALLDKNPSAKLAVAQTLEEFIDGTNRKIVTNYIPAGKGLFRQMRWLNSYPATWVYGLYCRSTLNRVLDFIMQEPELVKGADFLILFYFCFAKLVTGTNDTCFVWRGYVDHNQSREKTESNFAPMTVQQKNSSAYENISNKFSQLIQKNSKKIRKVGYLIRCRRWFLHVATLWIRQETPGLIQRLVWRIYLWFFVGRRVYAAHRALKYSILRSLFRHK